VDFDKEYDIIQKIGEGWFSRVYLTEHRGTREEIVLKAINSKTVAADEFLREYQNSHLLSAHKNVLTVYDVWFQVRGGILTGLKVSSFCMLKVSQDKGLIPKLNCILETGLRLQLKTD
jgi:serine/threonine protein kinase